MKLGCGTLNVFNLGQRHTRLGQRQINADDLYQVPVPVLRRAMSHTDRCRQQCGVTTVNVIKVRRVQSQ